MLFFTAVFCSARIFILSTRSFPFLFCQTATLRTLSAIRCKSFFRYLNMSVPPVQAAIYTGPPAYSEGLRNATCMSASLIYAEMPKLKSRSSSHDKAFNPGTCWYLFCSNTYLWKIPQKREDARQPDVAWHLLWKSYLKSCVTVIDWLAVSYGFSIETESDETVMGRKTFR